MALEDGLGAVLGPATWLLAYFELLEVLPGLAQWTLAGVGGAERRFQPLLRPVSDAMVRTALGVTPARAQAARDTIRRVFDDVGERLSDGRPYLCGQRFTAADLAFGALAGAVVGIEHPSSPWPPPSRVPAAWQQLAAEYRAHPAGAFAARLWAEER